MADGIHILGVRHHGPGSARSVRRVLDELRPQCVLIEGPPDADDLIAHAANPAMTPPLAILVHDVDAPASAVYYPFAEFSPEWQAMRWALDHAAHVRFMDLPQWHRQAAEAEPVATDADAGAIPPPPHDPLQRLAEAAGFDDGERWWEHVVESHRDHSVDTFAAIREAMAELRQSTDAPAGRDQRIESLREAWMRRTIREARKQGYASIAVVCGAWHAPALDVDAVPKKQDDELLKGLAKTKTAATWVPWTYDRMTVASGYGAGVHSPGWYEHLWRQDADVVESWMTRVARTLREKDIDCSSAHVIEAVRLSESLAAMRGRPLADLSDIADATRSIFCFDSDLPMRLIAADLLVGRRLGEVSDDVPMVPLQQDLIRQQKRLRLKPEAQDKQLDLDLRTDTDRQRSVLLHRLRLLGIGWGTPHTDRGGKGTFKEGWRLRWEPAFAIRLIEAGVLGATIEQAATGKLARLGRETPDLAALVDRLQDAILADLGDAAAALVRLIEDAAAVSADVSMLMRALPPLVSLVRYGNVRDSDQSTVRHIVDGITPRITAGIGGAVGSLNDDAAADITPLLHKTNEAVRLLESAEQTADWNAALVRVVDQPSVHGLVRGTAARLLLDAGEMDNASVALRLGQTLSPGTEPAQGARWLEGFLGSSGLLLIHDPKLLSLIDGWMADIDAQAFENLLPLLRRTFSAFAVGERRQIGGMIKSPKSAAARNDAGDTDFDRERAARVLPLLTQLLGGTP